MEKLGLRLTESVLDQHPSRETEASSAEDFVDFKRFICNELAELKAKYDNDIENFDSTEHCFKDHPFCRIIFNNLQARIESLEKQRQDQQKIIEMSLACISFESGVRSQEDEQNVKTRLKEELVNKSKQNCKEKKDTISKRRKIPATMKSHVQVSKKQPTKAIKRRQSSNMKRVKGVQRETLMKKRQKEERASKYS